MGIPFSEKKKKKMKLDSGPREGPKPVRSLKPKFHACRLSFMPVAVNLPVFKGEHTASYRPKVLAANLSGNRLQPWFEA